MFKITSDRRLFAGTLAMLLMCWKPELAQTLMIVSLGITGANAAQAVLTKEKPNA